MVKNYGGNKGKKIARKNISLQTTRILREKNIDEEMETYAAVIKVLGGSNCEIICEDGIIRNCIIRNKFRGRSKRDNWLSPNVWVLVGLREWEVKNKNKKECCDLLYVYTEEEKGQLKNKLNCNWRNFAAGFPEEKEETENIGVDFATDNNEENDILIQKIENTLNENENDLYTEDDDIIDIDEI